MLDSVLETTLRHALESPRGISVESKNPTDLKRRLWQRRKELAKLEPEFNNLVITLAAENSNEVWIIPLRALSKNPRPIPQRTLRRRKPDADDQ